MKALNWMGLNCLATAVALVCSSALAQDAPPDSEPNSAPRDEQRQGPRDVAQDRVQPRNEQTRNEQQREGRDARDPRDPRPEQRRPSVQRQEAITVRGNRQLDDRQVNTASKLVITKEDMEKFGDTNIADVLKRAPGVTIGGAAGRGGGEIRMRGLGAGYTQILINGEPAPRGFSLDTLSPEQLERIEIFRTATAQYSTQAVAGSINIVLKDGDLPPEKSIRVGVRGGSRSGVFANFGVNDKVGKLTYNLGASFNRDKNRYNGQTVEEGADVLGAATYLRINQQSNQGNNTGGNLNARLRYELSAIDSFSLDVFARSSDYLGVFDEASTTLLGTPPRFAGAHSDVEAHNSGTRLRLNHTRKLEGGGKIESRVGSNRNARNSFGAFEGRNAAGVLTLLRQTDSGATDNGKTAASKLTLPLGDGHQVVAGVDIETNVRSEFRTQDEQNPTLLPGLLPLVFARENFGANVLRTAVFAQDEWDISRTLSAYLGLRAERIRTTSEGNSYAPIENSAQVLSPIAQTLWKVTPRGDQVRVGLSRTFKAPGTSQLIPRRFTAVNNTAITPDSMGNPLLKPELATGVDLAYEKFFGAPQAPGTPPVAQGVFSVSTYVRRIRGVIFNQTTLQGTGPDARWVSMPTNVGNALVRGLELELKSGLRNFWPQAPAIDVRMNAARNHSTVDNIPGPGNRLASQTPCSANVGFDHRVNTQWSYGSSFAYSCGGYFRRSATQSGIQSDKRELDAYALWRMSPGNNLRVSAVNLLARRTSNSSTNADTFGSLTNTSSADTHAALRVNMDVRFR